MVQIKKAKQSLMSYQNTYHLRPYQRRENTPPHGFFRTCKMEQDLAKSVRSYFSLATKAVCKVVQ